MCLSESPRALASALVLYFRSDISTNRPMTQTIPFWCDVVGYSACGYYYNNVSIHYIYVQLRVNVIFFSLIPFKETFISWTCFNFPYQNWSNFLMQFIFFSFWYLYTHTHRGKEGERETLRFTTYLSIDGFVFLFLILKIKPPRVDVYVCFCVLVFELG